MDLQLEKQLLALVGTYGLDVVWKNALLLSEAYNQPAAEDTGEPA